MRTFAQTQHKPQPTSSSLARPGTIAPGLQHRASLSLRLSRTMGNQAVQRRGQPAKPDELEARSSTQKVIPFAHDFSQVPAHPRSPANIQAKLTVSTPGDIYEQEADRISEQVIQMPEARLQRACACGGECPQCRTEQPAGEHGHLQARHVESSDAGQMTAPPNVSEVLASPGQPLDPGVRAFMEPRIGYDFSRVRVHSGPAVEQAARDINAHAYTVGHHIAFGAGRFAPGTLEGRRLLAHELTHVVQQSGADGIGVEESSEKPSLSPISAARFAAPAMVQRACGEKQIGEVEAEDSIKFALGDPGVVGTPVRFRVGCDEFLTRDDEALLRSLAGSLPQRTRIIIHGFASEEGSPTFNLMLSVARAWKVREILAKILDPNQIERVVAHGAIPGNRADRRAVILQTQDALPKVTKTLTIVSWINGTDLPSFSRAGLLIAPHDSVAPLAACMALRCTANPTPPASLPPSALSAFLGSKEYRGVQNYTLTYIPSSSARGEFFLRQIPGYTAPSSCGPVPPKAFQLGETSPLNYATANVSNPNPTADALMKFRVSSVEESSAIDEATSFPASVLLSRGDLQHVPWVWTQTHAYIDAKTGKLNWVVRGSAFPTHTIYLDGAKVDEIPQGPCRVVTGSRFRSADQPRQTMEEEAKQARVPINKQEETVEPGGTSNGAG